MVARFTTLAIPTPSACLLLPDCIDWC